MTTVLLTVTTFQGKITSQTTGLTITTHVTIGISNGYMKATSIPPGCNLEEVPTVLRALANRFGQPVFAYFNDYRVDSTMTDEEIIDGYRARWEENHKVFKSWMKQNN